MNGAMEFYSLDDLASSTSTRHAFAPGSHKDQRVCHYPKRSGQFSGTYSSTPCLPHKRHEKTLVPRTLSELTCSQWRIKTPLVILNTNGRTFKHSWAPQAQPCLGRGERTFSHFTVLPGVQVSYQVGIQDLSYLPCAHLIVIVVPAWENWCFREFLSFTPFRCIIFAGSDHMPSDDWQIYWKNHFTHTQRDKSTLENNMPCITWKKIMKLSRWCAS